MSARTQYGELIATENTREAIAIVKEMIKSAADHKRIPAAFDSMEWVKVSCRIGNKRIGEALHHEIYDISEDRRRALVCCRSVEGTRYGIKTTSKQYFIIARHGRGVRVTEANKAIAAKAAKQAGDELGLALAIVEGKARLVSKLAEKRSGYKLLAIDEIGNPISAWDGSDWAIGVTRTEKATDDHTGGYYYYRDLERCLDAAARNETFGNAREHRRLLVVEVEASGAEYDLGYSKLCATRIRPLRIVCSII